MKDYFVLHSGGLDSTVALAKTLELEDCRKVYAIGVDYGQRHLKELESARAIRDHYGVESFTLDLTGYGRSVESALTSDIDVPEGRYETSNMSDTVVPGRNVVFMAAAAGLAASKSDNASVVIAVHSGDHFIYPDCRPEFIDSMRTSLELATGVGLYAPFVDVSKSEIVRIGSQLGAPLHLTWSCYKGEEVHCGVCGTCVERRESFEKVGVEDLTSYRE